MFKCLAIKDFQSHEKTKIEFSPNVTAIVGQSNVGKTSVVRALNWLVNNRPRGDSFIRKGEKEVEVTLDVVRDDKVFVVVHTKGKKGGFYKLRVDDNSEISFEAFGADVPREIEDVLNLSDINVQGQFESYFLVLDPPGKVALQVNEVTKLDQVDKIVSLISKRFRDTSRDVESLEESSRALEEKLGEIRKLGLDNFEKDLNLAEDVTRKSKMLQDELENLSNLSLVLEEVEKKLICLPESSFILRQLSEESAGEYDNLQKKFDFLCEEIKQLEYINDRIVEISNDDIVLWDESKECLKEVQELVSSLEALRGFITAITDVGQKVVVSGANMEVIGEERKVLVGKLNVCPTCGQDVEGEAKKKMMNSFHL